MVATTSSGELVVSEFCKISISRDGERIRNIDTTSVRSGITARHKLDPWGFAVDEDSNITDWESHRLFKFNSDGKLVKSVGGEGGRTGQFDLPRGIIQCLNSSATKIWSWSTLGKTVPPDPLPNTPNVLRLAC